MGEEPREEGADNFETLAEWTIRRLRPLEDPSEEDYPEKVKRWVLYSLGLDKLHQDIVLYLEKNFRSTTTDIAGIFDVSPNTARKYLDELHTVGLVDYIGREYTLTYESLTRAIELMLIPRIVDTLRTVARRASVTDFPHHPLTHASVESGDVVEENGVIRVNKTLLEGWYDRGKRVVIKSYSSLTIDDDIDISLFETVVERVESYGKLKIPSDFYAALSHKFRVWGRVKVY